MKNLANHPQLKLWIGTGIGVGAVGVAAAILILARHTPAYSTATVTTRNLEQTVRSTGIISAEQSSTLSFSAQGKIQDVLVHAGDIVHKGDTLAYLDGGTVKAQLDGAVADLSASEAQLSKLETGARPEELALYQQKYSDASAALVVAMNNAYFQASDAITNKTDTLFINGNSVNPNISIRTDDQNVQISINQERTNLRDSFNAWKTALSAANTSTSSLMTARSATKQTLAATQTFLSDLGSITNALSVGNSGLSQTAISNITGIVNGASQEVTAGANAFTTADAAWSSASDSLVLEDAGARAEDIAAQSSVMAKAQAQVEAYQSSFSQTVIRAPFDGTITEVNMKAGEVVVPGISANENIGIINTDIFNIDTYVPENAIGLMAVGNPATVTSDAYGSSIVFPAHVYLISPAETSVNGVNSYKVTLRFDQADARIRSGLTVNAVITTATATDALAIPTRAVITRNGQKYVLIRDASGSYVEKEIEVGISDSQGYTQIISGLNEGEAIASFGVQNY
jgi:HlyD family secretion protein